jgi:enoyl-CoA hydratase/carnithine racemase
MFRRLLPLNTLYRVQLCRQYSLLTVTETDGIRDIVLNDPKTRNCLSLNMMENLIEAIKKNENDKSLRVITLSSGSGPVFSSGHNLKELSHDKKYEEQKLVFDKCHELINSMVSSPVPIIAKVNCHNRNSTI